MNEQIPTIKQELERRLNMCSKTTFNGFIVYAKKYVDFVEKVPILNKMIIIKSDVISKQINEDSSTLNIHKVMLPSIFNAFYKELKSPQKSSPKYEKQLRIILTFLHDQLMSKLIELEISIDKSTIEQSNKFIKQLFLTEQSKWEDIEIIFTNEFNIRIRHKDNECVISHEQMGFDDKRKKDETCAKASWDLLKMLSMNKGVLPLPIKKDEKEKYKKQKQELSKILKSFFEISGNPFYKIDKENKEYKIKINLIPDPDFRPDWKDRNIYDDNKEYLKSIIE